MADKLRPDELAAFKAAFDMFDKNQDGTISTKVNIRFRPMYAYTLYVLPVYIYIYIYIYIYMIKTHLRLMDFLVYHINTKMSCEAFFISPPFTIFV